jgi:DNA polymerase-3 subunit delta'
LLEIATDDAKALTEERDAQELEQARASVGLAPDDAIPANMRTYFRSIEEQQKRRATRSLRDGIDRILVDVMGLFRDVVRVQLGVDEHLINQENGDQVRRMASARTPEQTLAAVAAIEQARERLAANVAPALVLEAMLIHATKK